MAKPKKHRKLVMFWDSRMVLYTKTALEKVKQFSARQDVVRRGFYPPRGRQSLIDMTRFFQRLRFIKALQIRGLPSSTNYLHLHYSVSTLANGQPYPQSGAVSK